MATPAAHLSVLVTADTKMATRGLMRLNTQLAATDAQSGKSKAALAGFAKTAGKAGALGAVVGLAAGAKKAFGEFREAQKVTNQTNAVLKSTGNQAKVTAREIENLASKISLKSGIDDEAIQKGQNLLLTFTKIRNETGRGNQVFDRATQVITDMSVALDQDLKSSAIQVGKALQDPEKGITALRRVGVNFTQTQSDMIQKWVAHGQQLKAQKFILRELTTEFGGSAAAQADSADKLRVAWDNMFESIGKAIGPTIEKVMGAMARFINQMQSGRGAGGRFAKRLEEVGEAMRDLWPIVRTGIELLGAWAGVTRTVAGVRIPGLIQVLLKLANPITRTIELIRLVSAAVRALSRFFTGVAQTGRRLAGTVGDALAPAFDKLKGVVNAALSPLRKAVGLLKDIAGLAGKIPGVLGDIGGAVNPFGKGRPLEDFFGQFAPFAGLGSVGALGKKGARSVDAFTGIAGRFGLSMTSGYRPGDDGWHGQNRARDYSSGNAASMMAFAQFMAKTFGGKLLELIYTPLGFSIKNGQRTAPYAQADHYDHVHVAMQRGGAMVPGSGSGDKVHLQAMVEPGEGVFVLNRNATAALGALQGMNSMFPRFQEGGEAGGFQGVSPTKEFFKRVWNATKDLGGRGFGERMPSIIRNLPRRALDGNFAQFVSDGRQVQLPSGFGQALQGKPNKLFGDLVDKDGNPVDSRAVERNFALQTLVHEYAHAAQPLSKMARWEIEGGAESFAHWAAPKVYGKLGIPFAESSGMYPNFVARVQKNKSTGWIRHGQFLASGGLVARAAQAAGFRGNNLVRAVAEAKGESGWNEFAVGDGGNSIGLMQIHLPSHPWAGALNLKNPFQNMKAAMRVFKGAGQSWAPWHANHYPHLGAARAAVASIAGKAKGPAKKLAKIVKPKKRGTLNRKPYGGIGRGGILDAFINFQTDRLNMATALAALTPTLSDDIAVARDAVGTWETWLNVAQRNKIPAGITATAQNLKSARDLLAELLAPVPSDTSAADAAAAEMAATRAGLLEQLLREANQRTAVSQAQYGALKYGGQFQDGGVVPGPIGPPRVIVAHGGETVTPAGGGGVQVIINGDIVNTPRGKKPIDVRDIRARQRALPGRGGGG